MKYNKTDTKNPAVAGIKEALRFCDTSSYKFNKVVIKDGFMTAADGFVGYKAPFTDPATCGTVDKGYEFTEDKDIARIIGKVFDEKYEHSVEFYVEDITLLRKLCKTELNFVKDDKGYIFVKFLKDGEIMAYRSDGDGSDITSVLNARHALPEPHTIMMNVKYLLKCLLNEKKQVQLSFSLGKAIIEIKRQNTPGVTVLMLMNVDKFNKAHGMNYE